jgi:hypothetical protein
MKGGGSSLNSLRVDGQYMAKDIEMAIIDQTARPDVYVILMGLFLRSGGRTVTLCCKDSTASVIHRARRRVLLTLRRSETNIALA